MGLSVDETLCFAGLLIENDSVIVTQTTLPETIRTNVIGRRLGDVIGHWALSFRGIADRIIESVETDLDDDLVFHLDDAE
ncbi:hypothetical protein [Sphingopyxis sp. 2PD]|uniref:hypothetical protein n=1 Tax=Sphingopyxis sp. 2PD TaxID=2502196 RepID=UPI0010F9D804|nr:hypothetical protein [Sphingopyxis sp. 2PD]